MVSRLNYMDRISSESFTVVQVTKNNWNLFEKLFGKKGASGNCWCMYYRTTSSEFKAGLTGNGNKNAIKKIIYDGKPAGLLGLLGGEPVAWCAFAPREHFIRLEKSRYPSGLTMNLYGQYRASLLIRITGTKVCQISFFELRLTLQEKMA